MPIGHLMDIAFLFRSGIVGWQADARAEYTAHAQRHNSQELTIAVNSKNHKPKRVPKFETLYPTHDKLQNLSQTVDNKLASKLDGLMSVFKGM